MKNKFEPKDNKILHGAGQDFKAFKNYGNSVENYKPKLYMTYVQIKWLNTNWFKNLKKEIKNFPGVWLQIGLSMTDTHSGEPEKHYEDKVAEGEYDKKIDLFLEEIKKLKIPCFVRLGYEFNGLSWYGYQPKTFVKAWKHVINKARKNKLNNVAWVWHYAASGEKNYVDYYPGDNYVDWWAITIFSIDDLKKVKLFIKDAKKHKKPIMIAESSAQYIGTKNGQESWNKWFKPFFNFIDKTSEIKAFCYINWNWAEKYKLWKKWGDCRIEENEIVKKKYIKELSKKKYIHNK